MPHEPSLPHLIVAAVRPCRTEDDRTSRGSPHLPDRPTSTTYPLPRLIAYQAVWATSAPGRAAVVYFANTPCFVRRAHTPAAPRLGSTSGTEGNRRVSAQSPRQVTHGSSRESAPSRLPGGEGEAIRLAGDDGPAHPRPASCSLSSRRISGRVRVVRGLQSLVADRRFLREDDVGTNGAVDPWEARNPRHGPTESRRSSPIGEELSLEEVHAWEHGPKGGA